MEIGKEVLAEGRSSTETDGRLQRAVESMRQARGKRGRCRRLKDHYVRGRLNRALANNLACRAGQPIFRRGQLLHLRLNPRGVPRDRRLTVVMQHGHPKEVDLQQHQRVRRDSSFDSVHQTTCHNNYSTGTLIPAWSESPARRPKNFNFAIAIPDPTSGFICYM